MQNFTIFRSRWLPILLVAGVVLSSCSRANNSQTAAAEQKAFAGDRSQMPQAEQLRIQQMQQQAAGRMQNAQAQAQQGRH